MFLVIMHVSTFCSCRSLLKSYVFRWGCKHEDTARKTYKEQHQLTHSDGKVKDAGFTISPLYPFVGASPDGYVSCSCCGLGILEIKCPFCAKDETVEEAASNCKQFCLERNDNGALSLKKDHAYFYQVQMQLFVTDRAYCDFVIWTDREKQDPFVQRITPDVTFFESQMLAAKEFFVKGILPELLGKFYSAPKQVSQVNSNDKRWCYCMEPEAGIMLVCQSSFCKIEKFHKDCLGIKRVPKSWLCPGCRKIVSKEKRDGKKDM